MKKNIKIRNIDAVFYYIKLIYFFDKTDESIIDLIKLINMHFGVDLINESIVN